MDTFLSIKNLVVTIDNKLVIDNLSLDIDRGKVSVIMGPNGSGKSSLVHTLAGHPRYIIESGHIILEDQELTHMSPEERAKSGIFVGFQTPLEIPGVTNLDLLKASYNSVYNTDFDDVDFKKFVQPITNFLKIEDNFLNRGLNAGFSGGEKKKNELLQMMVLNPKCAILDEIDSGLDVDALRIVSKGISNFLNDTNSLLLITHYQGLFNDNQIKPDKVHVMSGGKLTQSGNIDLMYKLGEVGFEKATSVT